MSVRAWPAKCACCGGTGINVEQAPTKEKAVPNSVFDVVVLGTGAAGQTVAALCAQAGKSVAVVDRIEFGGTCSLRG
jgi:ribulose 1,5-bisphosphate synthetase/thiazole synthase